MLASAMKGELGPWAQAVATYQMEQKIKKVLEKYKLSTGEPLNSNHDSVNDMDNKVDLS